MMLLIRESWKIIFHAVRLTSVLNKKDSFSDHLLLTYMYNSAVRLHAIINLQHSLSHMKVHSGLLSYFCLFAAYQLCYPALHNLGWKVILNELLSALQWWFVSMCWKGSAVSVLCWVLFNIHGIDLDETIGAILIQFSNDTNLYIAEPSTWKQKTVKC